MKLEQETPSVVLADDHPVLLSGLQGLLRPQFQTLRACTNGNDALDSLRELEPDLAVLDIRMPGLTGIEVLEIAETEGLRTKIVLLTAAAADTHIAAAVARGAWGLMLKDAAAEHLINCLWRVVRGERHMPPELVSPALAREADRRLASEQLEGLLTSREREIAILVAHGLSNKHIARNLSISEGTVKIHLHNAYQKLGVSNRTSLATLAQRHWGTVELT